MVNKKSIKLKRTKKNNADKLFSEARDEFLLDCRARNLSPHTIKNYEKATRYFMEYLGNVDIYSISDSDLKRWMIYLQETHMINSVRAFIKNVNIMLRYFNINLGVRNVGEDKKILDCYTDEEVKKLLIKPTRNTFGANRTYTMVCFLLATGVRTSTLINIKIKDLDMKAKTIFLSKTKTHKQYYIPMSSTLKDVLDDYLNLWDWNEEDYLFPNIYGEKLSPEALRHAISEYHKARGVKSVSVHKYRRTYASRFLKTNNNIFYLQMTMGHSDISTTRKYCTIDLDDIKKEFDKSCALDQSIKKSIKLNKK